MSTVIEILPDPLVDFFRRIVPSLERPCVPAIPEPLFDLLTARETLEAGWRRVRANKGAPGGDKMAVTAFEASSRWRLNRLRKALLCGSYQPGPIRSVAIPKANGGQRWLAIPCVVDRIVQTAVTQVLTPRLDPMMDGGSFGYRPKRSVAMAVERVEASAAEGMVWVVDGDIETFFDVVPHDKLMKRLAEFIGDVRLLGLIRMWLEGFSTTGAGLPQGSPLSPLLSNLYLDSLDRLAAGMGGSRWVRYADDFVLLCRDRRAAERAHRRIGRELSRHGLKLKAEKTRIVCFDAGFSFLGHAFATAERAQGSGTVPLLPAPAAALPGRVPAPLIMGP
ncbi:MAG: reverse transcriptase domain-containing protein [Defluviicoccus sp.]